jgi:putative phosphoesterase
MRLGILSDTHNQLERTRVAVQLLIDAGAEALVHCGDFTHANVLELCAARPCYFVFGNNDDFTIAELKRTAMVTRAQCLQWGGEVELAGKRIAITHGHMPGEVRRLLAAKPDYLLSGHSHIANDSRTATVRRINPGALHRAKSFSIAVLDLVRDEVRFIEVPR